MRRPAIVYCHLNDDLSGSCRILAHSIRALASCLPDSLVLVSSSSRAGFLERAGFRLSRYPFDNMLRQPWLALSFVVGQIVLFLRLARARPLPGAPIYVNTFLPVGAALFGALTRRPVLLHSHEIPVSRAERMVYWVTVRCSSVLICVSRAHADLLPVPPKIKSRMVVVPNAMDSDFSGAGMEGAKPHRRDGVFNVLFAPSLLSPHKGIQEFLDLARALAHRRDIRLHLAAPSRQGEHLLEGAPDNVATTFGSSNLSPLYEAAGLMLNLSRSDLCVETFGLTIVEGMAFGAPAIVPPVGGPRELVREGIEGYAIDSRDTGRLASAVMRLADDPVLWHSLSQSARERSGQFTFETYGENLRKVVARFARAGA